MRKRKTLVSRERFASSVRNAPDLLQSHYRNNRSVIFTDFPPDVIPHEKYTNAPTEPSADVFVVTPPLTGQESNVKKLRSIPRVINKGNGGLPDGKTGRSVPSSVPRPGLMEVKEKAPREGSFLSPPPSPGLGSHKGCASFFVLAPRSALALPQT